MLSRDTGNSRTYGTPLSSTRNSDEPATHSYLLIRNLPADTTEIQVRDLFANFRSLREVIVIKNSNNIYVIFDNPAEVQRILDLSEAQGFEDAGRPLKMCLVSKLPLDLNDKSSIVLVTIYNEKIEIKVDSIFDIFREFGPIRKIIIFKKKNYQVFIEFGSPDDAFFFKQALHNTNYKGFFFLKIQFTQKKELIVNGDDQYERDFTANTPDPGHSQQQGLGQPPYSTTPAPNVTKYPNQTDKLSLTEVPRARKVGLAENQSTRILTGKDIFTSANSEFKSKDQILSTDSGANPSFGSQYTLPYQYHTHIHPENIITSLRNLDFPAPKPTPSQDETFKTKYKILESDNASQERLFFVCIGNLSPDIKHKPIFNLFSLYGNIDHISLDSSTNSATVAYNSDTARQTACTLLNGAIFFGRPISVTVIKEPTRIEPVTKSYYFNPNQQSPISPLIANRQDRSNVVQYKITRQQSGDSPSKLKTITKPTHCLYVFNIASAISLENLKELFENFEFVAKMFYTNDQQMSAIFQFQSVESAIKILSIFKNFTLLGKNLKINFANEVFLGAPLPANEFRAEEFYSNSQQYQKTTEIIQSKASPKIPESKHRVTSLSGQLPKHPYF